MKEKIITIKPKSISQKQWAILLLELNILRKAWRPYGVNMEISAPGLKAIINVYRPGTRQSQATMTYVTADGTYRSYSNDDSMSVPFYSACNNYHTDAMLGIKFYYSAGDVDDHKIRVYGVTT